MFERRKYQLPQKKFRHIAKTKISNLTEQKKKFERELRKAKGKVSTHNSKIVEFIYINFIQVANIQKEDANAVENVKKVRMGNLTIDKLQAEISRIENEIKNKEKHTQ